jgi:anti-anti-sigma factor
MEKQTIKIDLTANLDFSGLVRHVANEVFENAKFSKAWCGRLKLVVDELFMNAVKYGSTDRKSLVHLTFEFDDQGVDFTIEDDGTGPKAKSAADLKAVIEKNAANKDLTRTSGRGLALITKMWTDGVQVAQSTYGGIGIGFTKKLENAGAPPAAMPAGFLPPLEEPSPPTAGKPSVTAPAITANSPVVQLKVSGEIDQTNMAEKIAPIVEQIGALSENSVLALDLSDLTYINSTFIGHLADWYRILQGKRCVLRLAHVSVPVKEILSLVGLINILEIVD